MLEKSQVIKDFVLFAVFGLVGAMCAPTGGFALLFVMCFIVLGFIPFGWRWASNIITAVSLYGIVLKLMICLVLGLVAGPVTLGKDIILLLSYGRNQRA